ncbi:hypothetical protein Lfu02_32650 [Longispora fulva]|uniref:Lipoprotein n=1 Tax=Longispora fulva TaxID=619741 RepID=A0A8J7KIB3_9ACTN|nr:hypothetical protein [Longispora fulva]MBG6139395.1 hypothetical protein [Longispora fulva]GIG58893.1 hypothetical protein Lfu02_32650 [Longispora fulva]
MRPVRALLALCVLAVPLSGCSDGPPPKPGAAATRTVAPQEPRAQLAGLVAAALDHRYTASYTYTPKGQPARKMDVALGVDGSWRIDIPNGALGGTANISMVSVKDGVYQCGVAPVTAPATPGPATCVKLAAPVPGKYDVRVQHLFTDWLPPLTSRSAALSVAVAKFEAPGSCYSVESTSASIAAPVDPGTYCFSPDGVLTGARIAAGTLVLVGAAAAPPASVPLPGPVSGGPALQLAALPPAPTPTPTKKP